jgi:hypothetical protein
VADEAVQKNEGWPFANPPIGDSQPFDLDLVHGVSRPLESIPPNSVNPVIPAANRSHTECILAMSRSASNTIKSSCGVRSTP